MPTNDFLPFGTGGGANVIDQPTYAGLSARSAGFVAGVAASAQLNKAWRQSSSVAAMIGQFTADHQSGNVVDDGNTSNFETQFLNAMQAVIAANTQVFLQASQTYYVNSATGSDSNSGLASGTAFATLQRANNIISLFNLNGFGVTVNVANGTYPPVSLSRFSGSGTVTYIGNTTTPSNCVISGSSTTAITANGCGSGYTFNGFGVTTTGAFVSDPMAGISASGVGTSITLLNMSYAVCGGTQIASTSSALVALGGKQLVTGGSAGNASLPGCHIYAYNAAVQTVSGNAPLLTISNVVNWVDSFIHADDLAFTAVVYGSITNPGNYTGKKFAVTSNSIISTGSGVNYYPGSLAGTFATGGQYI